MINNLVLFKQKIIDSDCGVLKFYLDLCNKHLLNTYAIFTDSCNISINGCIPIFHTFYLRHNFNKKIILTDKDDYTILKDFGHNYGKNIIFDHTIQEHEFIRYLEEICND